MKKQESKGVRTRRVVRRRGKQTWEKQRRGCVITNRHWSAQASAGTQIVAAEEKKVGASEGEGIFTGAGERSHQA